MVEPTQGSQSGGGEKDPNVKIHVKAQRPPARQTTSEFSTDLGNALYPSLRLAGFAGGSGILFGGFTGILTATKYPVIRAISTGVQFATFAATFDVSRSSILHYFGGDVTPKQKVQASAAAGALGGALASTIRGALRAAPSAIIFAVFGATGQWAYTRNEAQNMNRGPEDKNAEKHSWLNSRFSPVKVLTDKEYNEMLQEKLLNVNAQIALIDESIEALRRQERDEAAKGTGEKEKPKSGSS